MRLTRAIIAVAALALTVTAAPIASAELVPVNPGAIAAGRPIIGTTQNLPPLKSAETYDSGPGFADVITEYYTSGDALKDQSDVSAAALKWVRKYVDSKCGGNGKSCKAMVVFDIDETLVNNYELNATNDPQFLYDSATWDAAVENCTSPLNKPVADFYKSLRALGVVPAIVTGRSQSQRDETVTCLRKLGIDDWYELVTRTDRTENLSASQYKAQQRAVWEKRGFTIVASIGDQVSDMAMGHLLRGFLLPNAMYFIP